MSPCSVSRRTERGVTLLEVALAGSVVAAVAAGVALYWAPKARAAEQDQTGRDAAVILESAETWQGRSEPGCPTLTQLVTEHLLSKSARLEDPWGERFRIECKGGLAVTSAGPDRQRGTNDDVRVVSRAE